MRKYTISVLVMLILLPVFFSATQVLTVKANNVEPEDQVEAGKSGSDIFAGVAVDYMGKLVFWVHDRDTGDPIEGTSVELWVTSLDRYVLFGMTDENGYFELDVAFAETGKDYRDQYSTDGTKFTGVLVRFPSNQNIKWRVYKNDWLEYPTDGVIEELNTRLKTDPVTGETSWEHVVNVELYQEKEPPESNTEPPESDSKPPESESGSTGETDSKTLPKTGVQTQLFYWVVGLIMLLMASVLLVIVLRRSKNNETEAQE